MIHKFRFKDIFLVLDINSGAVHVVDEEVFRLLDGLENSSAKEALVKFSLDKSTAAKDVSQLIAQEMLFTDDSYITDQMKNNEDSVVKAMCLHVAHDCNMICTYCFGEQGTFAGSKCLMSLEVGIKAIDYLIANSGSRRNLEIDFFGGEPLMNFEVVKKLVDYGREQEKLFNKNIRFTITTNGLLLDDEKTEYINRTMDNVILSIDGRPEVNDNMRKTVNGSPTYDVITKNYLDFVDKREGLYYVRGTFTRNNLDFTKDIEHLVNLGFSNVSVEPVVTDLKQPYALQESDRDKIFEEYDRLTDLYMEKMNKGEAFDFFHFNVDLEQGPCIVKRLSGCGAGTEYLAISPEGDIYPCHQFVGNKDFYIGNLFDSEITNKQRDKFLNASIYNKEDCRNCWAKFYCSGGCHANAINISGDINKPYKLGCDLEKKRLECAIGIYAKTIE
ncbi:MAG: thioether cross-link-forming SCIFF peptide maturase [Peptostreptococcaceae bacterium]|nr:thioether cross-link-forming SCIFF peptide maturase [Peptostreptococcaceae bacterium]